jgi:hypothetical protein
LTLLPIAAGEAQLCEGDADGDRAVSVDELIMPLMTARTAASPSEFRGSVPGLGKDARVGTAARR